MEDQSYRLIVEYFEKTISDQGLVELQEWIEAEAGNLEKFSETIQILEASKLYFKEPENAGASWSKIQAHVNHSEKKALSYKIHLVAYAALFFLICGIAVIGYRFAVPANPESLEYAQISNQDGQHSRILLPDSSIVYLAGGSHLKYEKKFLGRQRKVYLDGEAFFDVTHQPKRAFVVQSGEISTVVLGTSFNIKAYTAEHKVEVTVKTGKVGVVANVNGKSRLLKYLVPNEQIEINTESGLYSSGHADAQALIGWINNNFVFYNTSLKEITASLEHRYGVKIEFTDPELGAAKLTAKFKNIPLKQVLEDIETLTGFSCTVKGKHIFISDNDQKGGKIME